MAPNIPVERKGRSWLLVICSSSGVQKHDKKRFRVLTRLAKRVWNIALSLPFREAHAVRRGITRFGESDENKSIYWRKP